MCTAAGLRKPADNQFDGSGHIYALLAFLVMDAMLALGLAKTFNKWIPGGGGGGGGGGCITAYVEPNPTNT
jgi:hypothetical protein